METLKLNRSFAYSVLSVLLVLLPIAPKALAAGSATMKPRVSSYTSTSQTEAMAGCNCSIDSESFSDNGSGRQSVSIQGPSGLGLLLFTSSLVTGYVKTKAAAAAQTTRSTASAVGRAIMPGCKLEESGKASYYGPGVGPRTATGERFNRQGMTAAHPDRDMLGKKVVLRDADTGKTQSAEINDLCPGCKPHRNGRIIDLSEGLFRRFASTSKGVIKNFQIWVCK